MALPIGSNSKDLCPGQRLEKEKNCHSEFIMLQDGYIWGWFFRKCEGDLFHFYGVKVTVAGSHQWQSHAAPSTVEVERMKYAENHAWL